MSESRRIAVIGSGFGGLSLAIRLQAAGFSVTILEKRDLPGGRAYVYHQDGFTFDAGPTVVTAPHCLKELWDIAGRRFESDVDLIPINPLYRLHWEDGVVFDYSAEREKTLSQIEKLCPRDVKGYEAFHDYTRAVFEAGFENLAHVPFLNWSSMVRVAPELLRLKAYRSVYSMVSKFLEDPHLRQAFSFHSLLVGGNPFTASSIYTLIHFLERKWGVHFPRGGTGSLVTAMVSLFERLGGRIRYQAEVDRIETKGQRVTGVRLVGGESIAFDAVASNADVARTYIDLLQDEPRARAEASKMERSQYSMSLFLVYFGVDRKFGRLAHHNVMFGSRYRELLRDIFRGDSLPDDFSLYVHCPSVSDSSLAPEGSESYYALSPVPHLGNAPIDWGVEGPKYADKILSYLDKRYLPGLTRHVVTRRIFTPQDFKSELNAHLGSAFSLEPLLTQSAYFRAHNREDHIRGLYFVGAGTHPGAGIPGVVSSAKATAGLIVEDFGREVITLRPKTAEETAALEDCREMIRVGSRSFSLASKLFRPETRDAACFLYGWCRFCDDQIDRTSNLRLQEERVASLREATRAAMEGRETKEPVYLAMRFIAKRYSIPSYYALELIEGMQMDVRKDRYWTVDDLVLYCYRVAGTVGLMMSHVMGVSEEIALKHATDLGIAMQMTNIARDVLEDAEMGRIYLPLSWLDEAGVEESQISQLKHRDAVFQVVRRLIASAERYYASGVSGLRFLPFRAALAVAVASQVYSAIGRKVIRRGSRAWDTRTVVSPLEKAWCVVTGLGLVLRTLPYRCFKPYHRVPLTIVWRHVT